MYLRDVIKGSVQAPRWGWGEERDAANKIVYPNPKFEKVLLLQSKVGISAYVTK